MSWSDDRTNEIVIYLSPVSNTDFISMLSRIRFLTFSLENFAESRKLFDLFFISKIIS